MKDLTELKKILNDYHRQVNEAVEKMNDLQLKIEKVTKENTRLAALVEAAEKELRTARCRNDDDCADPRGCVKRMREGIDAALTRLTERA